MRYEPLTGSMPKKLILNRETIRRLSGPEVDKVRVADARDIRNVRKRPCSHHFCGTFLTASCF